MKRENLAIDSGFADAASDELCVLCPKVKYYDRFVAGVISQKKEDLLAPFVRLKLFGSGNERERLYFSRAPTQNLKRRK